MVTAGTYNRNWLYNQPYCTIICSAVTPDYLLVWSDYYSDVKADIQNSILEYRWSLILVYSMCSLENQSWQRRASVNQSHRHWPSINYSFFVFSDNRPFLKISWLSWNCSVRRHKSMRQIYWWVSVFFTFNIQKFWVIYPDLNVLRHWPGINTNVSLRLIYMRMKLHTFCSAGLEAV